MEFPHTWKMVFNETTADPVLYCQYRCTYAVTLTINHVATCYFVTWQRTRPSSPCCRVTMRDALIMLPLSRVPNHGSRDFGHKPSAKTVLTSATIPAGVITIARVRGRTSYNSRHFRRWRCCSFSINSVYFELPFMSDSSLYQTLHKLIVC